MPIIPETLPGLPTDGNQRSLTIMSPAIEPATVEELKIFGRIDGTSEDTLLAGFIEGARINCEQFLGRSLIKQKRRLMLDYWPGMEVELPSPPLISVEGVYTVDEDDVQTLYDSSYYFIVHDEPARIVVKNGCTPPVNTSRYTAGFWVDFWAGYGEAATDVPFPIRTGIMLWAMQAYEQRNLTPEPPPDACSLLVPFRMLKV